MHKARFIVVLMCAILFGSSAQAQGDDIDLTDSTSIDWGGGTGGGINPNLPDEPVTSLTLSQTSLRMEGGQRVRLVATVNPRAMNKKILWTSSNNDIASVEDDGTVMALSIGTAVITATAAGNTDLKKTCKVTVTSNYVPPATRYILPWGRDEAWLMKYQQVEFSMDPGDISWTKPDFDDSSWPTLTGPMGNNGNDNGGRCPHNYEWEGDWNGYNLRRTFVLNDVVDNATYTFYTIHDDDLWVYLNGELIGNFEGWSQWNERQLTIPSDKFIRGRNVLALRIMEREGDQYFDYALHRKTPRVSQYSVVLPNVPFEFCYDARDYDPSDQCIPNHISANLSGAQLQLTENLPTVIEDGRALRISDRCEGFIDKWEKGSTESGAYFYRQEQDCMTIVAKVAPKPSSNASDFVCNRGAGYNYMWRIGSDYNISFLHTGAPYADERALFLPSEEPQVLAVRVFGQQDYILLQNLTTGDSKRVDGVYWGGGNNVFKLFYNDGGEFFLGDFYWVYYSFQLLTDSQLAKFAKPDFEDGIESIENEQLTNDNERVVYDLSGRRLSDGPAKAGLYIVGKKKVVINE